MNIQEVAKLKAGTKIYKVQSATITGYYIMKKRCEKFVN